MRLDLLGRERDQVANARARPTDLEGSAVHGFPGQSLRTGATLVAQVRRVNAQSLGHHPPPAMFQHPYAHCYTPTTTILLIQHMLSMAKVGVTH